MGAEVIVTRTLKDGSIEFTSVNPRVLARQMQVMQGIATADGSRPGERMRRSDGGEFNASYDAAAVKIAASGFSVQP